ncbi:TrkH family potassium uptake protein [Clostridium sporogenes]|uniref:TrkH family potassium uptake protein n=1 Tax=Clostridium botulinum TaxID=1491 RepID=A0A6M0T2G4_CLOBO|nr:TrkH family potassium uptake protein [Clostridium sporogenes]NFA61987.1 TrkH family potassium uptake protein [Clostridium botulinum]NFI72374.1 TrkH family potassium uptake protein [Clostridium sporogenes]NFL73830.1 TrkH family potassium uptake protein [Clostridium sporogenes]NFM25213.1 TrkH family potassium uptake protein [Clostridium sporogenes]NFP60778.1 TrkH family potassium uptake protein [Clostridium sporogenes]
MNYPIVFKVLGDVIKYEALVMLFPLITSFYYGGKDANSFMITIGIMLIVGIMMSNIKPKNKTFYAKEGFLSVSICWIVISLFGALPFYISGAIPSFVDCIFETVSGFTTTGATILTEVESLPRGILFWRSFTHWIGGMGILIFTLALMPSIGGTTIHLLKAESPGPTPGKIVPRIKQTAKIMYLIYIVMTIVQIILLLIAGMPFYDTLIHAFGTAGTGGFSSMNSSVGAYNNVYIEVIITVFMLLFGINFNVYFQLIGGNIKQAFKNEEVRYYIGMVFIAMIIIAFNIKGMYGGSLKEGVRQSSFQVASIVTTTGYATTNFDLWPTLSKSILALLMITGCCAGSTGGGIKTVRIVLLFKAMKREINRIIHPRMVNSVKLDGKVVDDEIISQVGLFVFAYVSIIIIAVLLVSVDGMDIETTLSSVLATIGNIGPGFKVVGPIGNFSSYSPFSKIVFSFCMLAGRLEIYPMLVMFRPSMGGKL